MKKMLLAVSMAFAATAVQATPFNIVDGTGSFFGTPLTQTTGTQSFSDIFDPEGNAVGYTEGQTGMLVMGDMGNRVEFTYLGKEASYSNQTSNGDPVDVNGWANGNVIDDTVVGSKFLSQEYAEGDRVVFGFTTTNPAARIVNGEANTSALGIIFFDATAWNAAFGTNFDLLIGYNDPFETHSDFDDYVVGVKALPVPAALPLMASALGMFGIARRRKAA